MVLREFVRLARQKLKPDEYFARMGGDNFVLLAKKERMGILLEQIDCMAGDGPLRKWHQNV